MGFLKKIRTNLLNQDNSFHIGFQNRNPIGGMSRKSSSPLNYTSQYSGDWTPTVQNLEQNPAGWIDPNIGGEWSKATTAAIKAVGDIGTAVVKNFIPSREEKEKKEKEKQIKEGRDAQYSQAFQEIGERIEEKPEFIYKPTISPDQMIPTTSTSNGGTKSKSTQDYKNEFNRRKCNFDKGTWNSTTNTCS